MRELPLRGASVQGTVRHGAHRRAQNGRQTTVWCSPGGSFATILKTTGFFKALPYRLAALLLRGAYRKARTFVPEFDASVQRHLNDLHEREREHCASLDQAAEPFAALMADIADCVDDEMRRRVMKEIFYHLGRWIYLVDAADDFEKDAHSNCYNPLRYRYELDGDKLDEQSREAVAASLDLSVHRMASRLRAALLRRVDKHFRQYFLRKPLWDRQCRSQGHVS